MRIKIIARKEKGFKGSNGEQIPYFWYTAERATEQGVVRFQFGSKDGEHEENTEYDLDLYREETSHGTIWKEQVNF